MRGYDEWVASLLDVVPPRLLLLALFAVTVLTSALWYTYPAWLRLPGMPRLRRPRWRLRLPRWRRRERRPREPRRPWTWRRLLDWLRLRRRRRPATIKIQPGGTPETTVEIPDPATERDRSLADRLAAEGRYAEAIRERLRDTVADLTRAGIVTPQPGWTAAELSAVAAANRPPLGPALGRATDLFSQVWYGRLDPHADEDERMRRLTSEVRSALEAAR